MTNGVYQYLLADDGVRQFALRIENDKIASIAVFADNPADAVMYPREAVFARNDVYALSAGMTEKNEGFDSKGGVSLYTQIYRIDTNSAGDIVRVTQADCIYYCFGIVSEDLKNHEPRLVFNCTRHSAHELAEKGFAKSKAAFAVPLPQKMLALARMEIDFDLSFDALKKIAMPQATLARNGIEQMLLPKAAAEPIWIASDDITQASNYSVITKKLRGRAP